MAKLVVVSVRDRAADAFMNPFVVPSLGMAIRSFSDEVNNPQGQMFAHPDDYDLYVLGMFDSDSGKFEVSEDMPKQVSIGKQMLFKAKVTS